LTTVLAQTAPAAPTTSGTTAAAPATSGSNGPGPILGSQFFPLIIGILILYFFVFRAKKNQDKKRTDQLNKLKPGQRVQTIGGIIGTITQVSEREITVKVDETNNVKIKFARNAIHRVTDDDAPAAAPKSETK
jgi:preprotein translocase subunit YajC